MRRGFWIGALGIAFILSMAWGFTERSRAEGLEVVTENQYHRSFNDLVTNLEGIENSIAKTKAAASPMQQVYFLGQTWKQSETAVKNIAMLPSQEIGMGYIEQLLNQVGEYTQILSRKVVYGGKIEPTEEKTLEEMHGRILQVNSKVQDIYTRVNTESLAWIDRSPSVLQRLGFGNTQIAEAAAEGNEGSNTKVGSVRSGLDQLDASLQKLPPLSYEGQTDTHTVAEPLGLPDKTVDQAGSKIIAENFLRKLGISAVNLQSGGASQGPLGGFIWNNNQVAVEVTKRGGVVILYNNDRPIGERKLNVEEAKKEALTNLKKLGWDNMVLTSVEDFGAYLQLEAVPEENEVRNYPDKIRFTVAKDNGDITGYDATSYYAFHHNRKQSKQLSLEQAKAKLRSGFNTKESRLTVIPKTGRAEALCYEFRGTYKDEEYLIYINAENGAEENILRIIKTPRGEYLQ